MLTLAHVDVRRTKEHARQLARRAERRAWYVAAVLAVLEDLAVTRPMPRVDVPALAERTGLPVRRVVWALHYVVRESAELLRYHDRDAPEPGFEMIFDDPWEATP